ncbi:MAG: hypothetical protein IKV52_01010 [Oscillospiraceae bacterium]|nr:hypothetical protein [Oscillospiraceae bacterium]
MNRALSISVAAFFAFVTAAIFVVLFMLEFLPSYWIVGLAGIVIETAVLLTVLYTTAFCCRDRVNNALGCFGRAVVFGAVIGLGLSLMLTAVYPTTSTMVLTGLIFAQVFLLIFTLFMLAFLTALSLPAGCVINTNGSANCVCSCGCDYDV